MTHAFDGIFIHSRGGCGCRAQRIVDHVEHGPGNLRIRTDLKVPVFMSETQTDLIQLGYAPAQQPNTDRIRTWEIAGTSHADAYLVGGTASILGCTTPVNSGPQHNVVQAAFTAFDKWVDDGTPPPTPAALPAWRARIPPTLALDAHGNVIGGVRTPAVDVPVSTLSGAAPAGRQRRSAPSSGRPSPFSAGHAGQPLPDQEQLHRRLHQEPGQGHRGRVHPRGRQGLAAGPGRAGSDRRLRRRVRSAP